MTKRNDAQDLSKSIGTLNVDLEDDAESLFDPLEEEITSYLDDELTSEERQDFERRLESDSCLKERFEKHCSAWNALELLVDVSSNVDVTESTVKRLNSETQTELAKLDKQKTRRNRLFFTVCSGASCVFVFFGYFLFSLFFPDVQKQRVTDRNVVSRLAQLEAIGDFEYLAALSRTDFFAKHSPQDALSRESESPQSPIKSQIKTEDERSYEELLQDRSFYRLQQRFERLNEPSKERWRLLWKKIEASPNKELLLKTLDNYSEWLTNFANDEERERLQTESVSERIADVHRKNEELARFWDHFSFRRQNDQFNNWTQKSEGKTTSQNQEKTSSLSPDDSAQSTPFATQMFMLRNLLPEELRREDFRSVYLKYELFCRNSGLDEKDDGILDFLKADVNVYDQLSESAKSYLSSLPEDERRSALSLITALCVSEKNASDYYRQNAFRRSTTPSRYGFRGEVNGGGFRNINRQNVSIRELANDLRNANSRVRDYITSQPSSEAQALLLGLHWAGGRMKLDIPIKSSDSQSLLPGGSAILSPSPQESRQLFNVSSSDMDTTSNVQEVEASRRLQSSVRP